MTETDVVALLDVLEQKGVRPWIDGGWGIDALLGRQIREHGDLDIVIEDRREVTTRKVLGIRAVHRRLHPRARPRFGLLPGEEQPEAVIRHVLGFLAAT